MIPFSQALGPMLQRFLLLWLLLLSAVAYFWPEVGLAGDPFVATYSHGLLRPIFAVAMFCIGGLLPRDELLQLRKRWFTVLAGTSIQYTVMPLLAVAVAMIFRLGDGLTVGLMLVGCVPGAMASNVLTMAARGNVSYSVSLTTAATLLSPLIVPVVLSWTLGTTVPFDPVKIFVNLLTDVVGPVIVGHLLSRFSRPAEKAFQFAGSTVANLAILWIIATVVGITRVRLAEITPVDCVGVAADQSRRIRGRLVRRGGDQTPPSDATGIDVGSRHAERGTGSRDRDDTLRQFSRRRNSDGRIHLRLHADRYDPGQRVVATNDAAGVTVGRDFSTQRRGVAK